MKNKMDYSKSNWIKRITDYEDVKEQEEYWKGECERKDDNIIRQINKLDTKVNEINTKLDAILFAVNTLLHSETNGNGVISKKKTKKDKLVEKEVKVENKANKRGRPRKVKGE